MLDLVAKEKASPTFQKLSYADFSAYAHRFAISEGITLSESDLKQAYFQYGFNLQNTPFLKNIPPDAPALEKQYSVSTNEGLVAEAVGTVVGQAQLRHVLEALEVAIALSR